MTFKICNSKYYDYFLVKGDNIEDIRKIVKEETSKRGWEDKDCWSELIEE